MRIKYLIICFTLISQIIGYDTLVVTDLSGANTSYNLDEISKLTFSSSAILLGGTGDSYEMDNVQKIAFNPDNQVAISNKLNKSRSFSEKNVTVAQCSDKVIINLNIHRNSQISVAIYSLNGRLIQNLYDDKHDAGLLSIVYNGQDAISNGIWLLKAKISDQAVCKQFFVLK